MMRLINLPAYAAFIFIAIQTSAAFAATPPPKLAAVMDFELLDDMSDYETEDAKAAQQHRLSLISNALRREFDQRAMYRIVENSAAAQLIAEQKARQDLRNCNGCEIDIGRALGADVIVIGWAQKVSNLILNLNIEVKQISSGQMLYVKSVDLRGNTDNSWLRGIRYMVDSIEEKKQHLR